MYVPLSTGCNSVTTQETLLTSVVQLKEQTRWLIWLAMCWVSDLDRKSMCVPRNVVNMISDIAMMLVDVKYVITLSLVTQEAK